MPRKRRTLNVELLRKVARKLRRLRHEEHYKQHTWLTKTSCGTAACIAGHTALVAGWRPASSDYGFYVRNPKTKEMEDVQLVAAELLGVDELTRLFDANPEAAWPEAFAERWGKTRVELAPKDRPSRIAADLLDALASGKVKAKELEQL